MNNQNEINEFEYLWKNSSEWALLHINSQKTEEVPRYLIVNTETTEALLIQDNNLYANVKKIMMEKGVKIITCLPQS